jgi:hypothetical protein
MSIDLIKISELPGNLGALSGAEEVPVLSAGTTYRYPTRTFVLPGDPLVTIGDVSGALPASRHLVVGAGLLLTDAGPGGTLTISLTIAPSGVTSVVAGHGIDVDVSDPFNPSVAVDEQELDVFTPGLKGVVPASGAGAGTTFLRDDGTFVNPSGGANSNVQFRKAGILEGDADFAYDDATKKLTVGGLPDVMTVNGVAVPATYAANSDTQAVYEADTHSSTAGILGGSVFYGARTRNTQASPAAVLTGDYLLSFAAVGWNGTDYGLGATISFIVNGTVSGTAMPTDIILSVSNTGSDAPTERFRVSYFGGLGIGGANFGTAGQALVSGGPSAAPSWQDMGSNQAITTTTLVSTPYNIDWDAGVAWDLTLDLSVTFTFSNPPAAGTFQSITLVIRQGSGGSRTITWPGTVKWSLGTAPVLSTTVGDIDVITLFTIDGGTTYFGGQVMADVA